MGEEIKLRIPARQNPVIKRSYPIEKTSIRNEDEDGKKSLKGIGIVYNEVTTLYESSRFSITEEIKPDCIVNMEDPDIAACFNHSSNNILARAGNKYLRMKDTKKGLETTIFPNMDCEIGRFVYGAVERRDVYGMSFMARIVRESYKETKEELSDGGYKYFVHYEVEKIKLREVGPVTFPQYTQTDIKVKRSECDGGFDSDTERLIERTVQHYEKFRELERMSMGELLTKMRSRSLQI